jgi:hypothetical protein
MFSHRRPIVHISERQKERKNAGVDRLCSEIAQAHECFPIVDFKLEFFSSSPFTHILSRLI